MGFLDNLGPISEIAGIATGAVQSISGATNLKKDKAELAALKPAFYKVQDEYNQNRNIAAQEAGGGLTSASKDLYESESQRGLGASVSALLQGGGDMNMIGGIFDKYNRNTAGLAAEDAQAHQKNIQYYQQANRDLAGQKTTQFVVNELQPYENKLKELTQRIQGDKANIWGGVQTAIGGLSAAGTQGPPKSGSSGYRDTDPYITPSKVDAGLRSTGDMSIDTSRALASFLSDSGSINL
jgi:hypothetical protein